MPIIEQARESGESRVNEFLRNNTGKKYSVLQVAKAIGMSSGKTRDAAKRVASKDPEIFYETCPDGRHDVGARIYHRPTSRRSK